MLVCTCTYQLIQVMHVYPGSKSAATRVLQQKQKSFLLHAKTKKPCKQNQAKEKKTSSCTHDKKVKVFSAEPNTQSNKEPRATHSLTRMLIKRVLKVRMRVKVVRTRIRNGSRIYFVGGTAAETKHQ